MMKSEDEYVIKVALNMQMTGKTSKGRPRLRWINNINSRPEEKNTSLNDVIRTDGTRTAQNGVS